MEPDNPNAGTSPAIPAPEPPSLMSTVFLGPHGLRAGWRFAIYVAGVVGLVMAFSSITRPLVPRVKGLPPLWFFLVGECEQLAAAVIPALVLSHFERRPFDDYGLPRRNAFGRNFWAGAVWGIVAITVLLMAMRGVGVFYFGGIALHGGRVLKFAAFWGLLFLIVGLFEEFALRGYSQFTLAQGMGFWPAAIMLSLAFGAVHLPQEKSALGNQGEAWVGALGAALIGLFFCLTLRRTGTLWFAVGMHASWDWGETFFYSVPNSGVTAPGHLLNPSFQGARWLTGGSVGPEGSVLLFVLIAAMWVVFDRMYPAKRTPES
jgi:membrane protease YdiL (CAAX protease family)